MEAERRLREQMQSYSCPKCSEKITRLPDNHTTYTCPQCTASYLVMIDEETLTVAFVDQAERPKVEPLGIPRGSVRAFIALSMAATACILVVGGQDVPGSLASLLLTIIGFYFGFRVKSSSLTDRLYDPAARREQPLHLPPGVIRFLLIALLAIAGLVLLGSGRLVSVLVHLELFVILAGLIAGHFFSRASRGVNTAVKSMIGHVKAAFGLVMAAALVGTFLTGQYAELDPKLVTLLCATISFYFGSRS